MTIDTKLFGVIRSVKKANNIREALLKLCY